MPWQSSCKEAVMSLRSEVSVLLPCAFPTRILNAEDTFLVPLLFRQFNFLSSTLETSAFESLYGGQFTLSTQLIEPNYLPSGCFLAFLARGKRFRQIILVGIIQSTLEHHCSGTAFQTLLSWLLFGLFVDEVDVFLQFLSELFWGFISEVCGGS